MARNHFDSRLISSSSGMQSNPSNRVMRMVKSSRMTSPSFKELDKLCAESERICLTLPPPLEVTLKAKKARTTLKSPTAVELWGSANVCNDLFKPTLS
jgi:hypothetical protein